MQNYMLHYTAAAVYYSLYTTLNRLMEWQCLHYVTTLLALLPGGNKQVWLSCCGTLLTHASEAKFIIFVCVLKMFHKCCLSFTNNIYSDLSILTPPEIAHLSQVPSSTSYTTNLVFTHRSKEV